MASLTLLDAQLAYGHVPLLDHANFSIEPRERIGLIGRNGAGKSSLLRILGGLEQPDDGRLMRQQGLQTFFVAQEPVLDPAHNVFTAASQGLADVVALREQYLAGASPDTLDALQTALEARDGWNWEQQVESTLMHLHLQPDALVGSLSGGMRKRVALAQALVARPDVLLLDEPTNHLDLDSIEWLEQLLNGFAGSVVTITHDRAFLDRVATRIVELDRGHLLSYPGNFTRYQEQKQQQLAQEAVLAAKADKLLAQEEVWIRKGVEARRTRSTARIGRLQALRNSRAARRDAASNVQLDLSAGERSGRIVAELAHVSRSFDGRKIVDDFSATILRGDKVGLIGPNGAGKTTLLKLILGELAPDGGSVRQGSKQQIAYFDQLRESTQSTLNLDTPLEDFISPGSEWIEIGQQRKHVKSYLADFLFPPARARSPLRSLSGGERNRLLLARLFARPANVLVLDEPTNDLDIDTLELLEELLQSYEGTVFLVSHDRRFLDNVVTSIIAYEGTPAHPGRWREYVGGVQDWLLQSERGTRAVDAPPTPRPPGSAAGLAASVPSSPVPSGAVPPPTKKKLSYKLQRELDALPAQIEALETEQAVLRAELADATLYQRDANRAAALHTRDGAIEEALMAALERWDELST